MLIILENFAQCCDLKLTRDDTLSDHYKKPDYSWITFWTLTNISKQDHYISYTS